MDALPIELLHEIASYGIDTYRSLLGIKFFAQSLNPHLIDNYQIEFGIRTIEITKNH